MRARVLTFLLVLAVAVPAVPAAAAAEITAAAAVAGVDYRLAFHARTVDPAADLVEVTPQGEALVLVQLQARGLDGVVDSVARVAPVVQPLAPVSLLVWADGPATEAIRRLDGVRFAGVLPADLRVAASVDADTTRLRVTSVAGGVRVVEELAGDAVLARALAARADVYSVAEAGGPPEMHDEKSAQIVATGRSEPAPGYDPAARWGVDGSGVTMAIVDTGIDETHPELDHAVVGCTDYSTYLPPGMDCQTNLQSAHGTHVAGIVAGDGSTGKTDADGFLLGQGVAPGVDLWSQDVVGSSRRFPGIIPLFAESARRGAVLAQNSWGVHDDTRGYGSYASELDGVVRDADPDLAGNQQLGLVFAIANGGGGKYTHVATDEAKNIIRVGGAGSDRDRDGDDLCTCTAHGPALDGRLLPDLVAPGQGVWSTAAGVISMDPRQGHRVGSGTSMAAPHVSGAYALFIERWRKDHDGATPSPALAKAALINTATDLSRFGGRDADDVPLTPIPNSQQGWGRMDVGALMAALDTGAVAVDQQVLLDTAGDTHEVTVEAVDPTQPVRVSLVWTDAPGHGMGGRLPALVNDLDLTVSDGTTTWLGNAFADGWSVTGGDADRINPTENVYLRQPGDAPLTLTVAASNLIGDAVPGSGDTTDQDFALFISNARITTPGT